MRDSVATQFTSLEIKRVLWGPDEGKILATLKITGRSADITVYIGDDAARLILSACAGIVANSAAEKAEMFRNEFLDAINGNANNAT